MKKQNFSWFKLIVPIVVVVLVISLVFVFRHSKTNIDLKNKVNLSTSKVYIPEPDKNFKQYINTEFGFGFNYPLTADFNINSKPSVSSNKTQGSLFSLWIFLGGNSSNVSFAVYDKNTPGKDENTFKNSGYSSIKFRAGIPAWHSESIGTGGAWFVTDDFIGQDYVYEFQYSSEKKQDKTLDLYNQIINSFDFVNSHQDFKLSTEYLVGPYALTDAPKKDMHITIPKTWTVGTYHYENSIYSVIGNNDDLLKIDKDNAPSDFRAINIFYYKSGNVDVHDLPGCSTADTVIKVNITTICKFTDPNKNPDMVLPTVFLITSGHGYDYGIRPSTDGFAFSPEMVPMMEEMAKTIYFNK